MDDMEKVFAEGLRRAASERPALPIDVDEVIARGEAAGRASVRRPAWRWLAVAAAVLLVAGAAVGVWFVSRPGSVPAVPVGSPSATPVVLTGTRWLATEIEGQPVETSPAVQGREQVPWLEFGPTTISGGDPCNGVGADYRLEGDRLRFERWQPHTDVGCNIAQQQRFGTALSDTTRAQRDGNSLAFLDASGRVVLRFRADASGSPRAVPTPGLVTVAGQLTGRTWWALELGGREVPDGGTGAVPRLTFLRSGLVDGADPCNAGSGRYDLARGGLTISEWRSTDMGCVGWVQQAFLDALSATAYATTNVEELALFDSGGTLLARFGAAHPSGEAVQVRVRNASGQDLTQIRVGFPDGTRSGFGQLAPGAASDYVDTTGPVYGYAYVEAWVDGRKLVVQPIDYVGETPLAPGRYTYVLDVDPSGDLTLALAKDG